MALFHEPELVILDEPANGLDPAGVVEVRDLLRSLAAERGVTVLMSSHILAEVDRLATRIGIIHRGRLDRGAEHRGDGAAAGAAAGRRGARHRAARAPSWRPPATSRPPWTVAWCSRRRAP